jgi:agmatine deiminase
MSESVKGPGDARVTRRTPREDGFSMPAEWAPHERCLMAWPMRRELWGSQLEPAKRSYAEFARAIARFEPVLMVADPGDGGEAAAMCGGAADVIELPIDDSWLRDSGPVFVTHPDGRVAAVDFQFNGWGGKWACEKDNAITALLCEQLRIERYEAPFVLEGGSIAVDGEGTMLTTESCLLHPNRNPSMSREDIERGLRDYLGVEKIVWIPWGRSEADTDTDGHIDGVAAFAAPGVVLLQLADDPSDRNYAHFKENRRQLKGQRDARGRPLETREFRTVSYVEVGGRSLVLPHMNFYLANGAVIAPIAEQPTDAAVLAFLGAAFPDREVVGVPGAVIDYGGGNVHCITQQQPKATASA